MFFLSTPLGVLMCTKVRFLGVQRRSGGDLKLRVSRGLPDVTARARRKVESLVDSRQELSFRWAYSTATALLFPANSPRAFSPFRNLDKIEWKSRLAQVDGLWSRFRQAPKSLLRSNEFRYRRAIAMAEYWRVVLDSPGDLPKPVRAMFYHRMGCSQAKGCLRPWLCPVCYAYRVVYPTLCGASALFNADPEIDFRIWLNASGYDAFLFSDVVEEPYPVESPLLQRAETLERKLMHRHRRLCRGSAGEFLTFSYYFQPDAVEWRLGCRIAGLTILEKSRWPKEPCSLEPLFREPLDADSDRPLTAARDAVARRLAYPYWKTAIPRMFDLATLHEGRRLVRTSGLLRGYRGLLKRREREFTQAP